MNDNFKNELRHIKSIERSIYLIRDQKVMLDFDLATLYSVETKALVQAVKRNIDRFPKDFMFQLSKNELEDWRSHIVTSNLNLKMGLRRPPYAFTEQGVAMLTHKELVQQLRQLEKKYQSHDKQFTVVFDAIRQIMIQPVPDKRKIGF